jgi:flavin-dependent dehydrogenase
MKNFDVVIIGAGLAGLQCAKLLSRSSATVLLVDRKENLETGIHTTGIFVRKTFEDFEFPSKTLGRPISDVTLYSPSLESLEMKSEKQEFRVGKMGLLYSALLDECVENGVEFMGGSRYISVKKREWRKGTKDPIQRNPGEVSTPTASDFGRSDGLNQRSGETAKNLGDSNTLNNSDSIVTLQKRGRNFQIRTKVLIGADGAVSRVAKDLGLDENREWIVGYEEVYQGVPLEGSARLDCFLDAKLAPGYLAWITNDGEESHIGIGGYPDRFDPRSALRRFRTEIASSFVNLKKAKLVETRGGRIPVGGVLKKIACEHGLLIGDASGAVSPLTAGGLDPCMRLSGFAAKIILERLETGNPAELLRYSGEMFRAKFSVRLFMRHLLRSFSYQPMLTIAFRFLRGKIGKKIAEKIFFRRGSFPDVNLQKNSDRLRANRAANGLLAR